MVKWSAFVEWSFLGLISAFCGMIVFFASRIDTNMSEMQKAINTLNSQVVVIIQENTFSKDALKDHEIRLREIERQIKQ